MYTKKASQKNVYLFEKALTLYGTIDTVEVAHKASGNRRQSFS